MFELIFIFIFGLIIGSFINCLLWRLKEEVNILGRSFCPRCQKAIAWYDNIPVLSYFLLRGKCRSCQKKISFEYPLVEITTALLFACLFYINYYPLSFCYFNGLEIKSILFLIRDLFFVSVILSIFIFDFKWYLIPDILSLPALLIIFVFNLFLGFAWFDLLLATLLGAGFFYLQFFISQGKWIGGGDIRLGALMGAFFALPSLALLSIFLSYLIGSFISIFLLIGKKKKWGSKVPLGIFLTAGAFITMLWGERILAWYLNLLGLLPNTLL